jgi:diadenosine tetraphosphate (Ap4A) HIT family hydrolase
LPVAELHPRLLADTRSLGETPLCWIRWMNDQRFAWLVLVPKRDGIREWYELDHDEQHELLDLVNRCTLHLQSLSGAQKMNIGALGNMVPQLHIHIIARHEADPCWPGPVWGSGSVEPWPESGQPAWINALRERLSYRCA